MKSCVAIERDGFFGPASIAAWQRTGLPLSTEGLPTPGDVAALAASRQACLPDTPLTEVLLLMGGCRAGPLDKDTFARASPGLAQLASTQPHTALDCAAPLIDLCGDTFYQHIGAPEALALLIAEQDRAQVRLCGLYCHSPQTDEWPLSNWMATPGHPACIFSAKP